MRLTHILGRLAPTGARMLTFRRWRGADRGVTDGFVLSNVGGTTVVDGLAAEPLPDSLENLNRFEFFGQGPINYLMLLCCIAVPVFMLATFVRVIRAPLPRRKWLWALFVLLGVGQIALDWNVGTLSFSLLQLRPLGSGWLKAGEFAPTVLFTSFPLGAILFFVRRRKW